MGFWISDRGGLARALAAAACLLLLGSGEARARADCPGKPVDHFSERIDSLLAAVEGSGFPADANLGTWLGRRGEIQASFGEILGLVDGDAERRRAVVETLIVARSISASPEETGLLGRGAAGGELRAWARRVLRDHASVGATRADGKFLNAEFIATVKKAWADDAAAHPQRLLPLYREKAGALRSLARFQPSPSCE